MRRLATTLLALASCGGETSTGSRVHIVSGLLVYNGSSVTAVMNLRIDVAAEATTFAWRAGAVPAHALCRESSGWRLDVVGGPTEVAANEPGEFLLRATSRDRPACDPAEPLARCGEIVTVLVMSEDDTVLAALDTTFECLFSAELLR